MNSREMPVGPIFIVKRTGSKKSKVKFVTTYNSTEISSINIPQHMLFKCQPILDIYSLTTSLAGRCA